jgi:hypothetical protein
MTKEGKCRFGAAREAGGAEAAGSSLLDDLQRNYTR